ncbi:hypothetical protein JCM11491_004575 [Sporobolomyces phaffii]
MFFSPPYSPLAAPLVVDHLFNSQPSIMKFSAVLALGLAAVASAAPTRLNSTNPPSSIEKRSYSGQATWYTQGGNPGACGNYASDSDYVVALSSSMYGGGGNCGRYIKVTNTDSGASTTVKVADECPTCEGGGGSIDLSTGAFEALGSKDQGVLPVSWNWA